MTRFALLFRVGRALRNPCSGSGASMTERSNIVHAPSSTNQQGRAQPHTPGTWAIVHPDDDFDNIMVCAFEGDPKDGIMLDVVAEVTSYNEEADARLIAAAPDMFEALRSAKTALFNLLLVAEVPDRFAASFNEVQAKAEAAIAKATGEPQ